MSDLKDHFRKRHHEKIALKTIFPKKSQVHRKTVSVQLFSNAIFPIYSFRSENSILDFFYTCLDLY
jgi:hypothetical protein